mgnify:CR=1 FL=1|jgi:hypothetical protein
MGNTLTLPFIIQEIIMNVKQSWERHNKEVIIQSRITLELVFYLFIILSPFIMMHLQFASL